MTDTFIDMRDNIAALIKAIRNEANKLATRMRFGFLRGVDDFRTWFIKTQLSGRTGTRRGLNRRSGAAYSQWLIYARQTSRDYVVTLRSLAKNKGFGYLLSHQYGATIRPRDPSGWLTFKIGNRWIRKKEVRIPKRITFVESFRRKWGFYFIEQAVRKATGGMVRGATA